VWMKHPGHTYGGFIPAISERGMTDGLHTGILRLRVPMDDILFYGKENVLTIERNRFWKLWFISWSVILASNLFCVINTWTKVVITFTQTSIYCIVLMCVDCVLASPRIAQVDPDDEPLPEVVLSQLVPEQTWGNTLVPKYHNYALSVRIV
jgi:hypothetical protein